MYYICMFMANKKQKYYVVWVGIEPGIYDNWEDAQEQVVSYPGAKYKSFSSYEQAVAAFRGNDSDECRTLLEYARRPAAATNYTALPGIAPDAIAVDAACSGNPGKLEYRGVEIASGNELFHMGPFPVGTNNIGEYLALVHALALCAQRGETRRTIYSDSRTALAWLSRHGSNTRLTPCADTAYLRQLLARADAWVQSHTWQNPVRKWPTDEWGEIPADFGRT